MPSFIHAAAALFLGLGLGWALTITFSRLAASRSLPPAHAPKTGPVLLTACSTISTLTCLKFGLPSYWIPLSIVFSIFACASLFDLKYGILPDELTLTGSALALIIAVTMLGIPPESAIQGAVFPAGLFLLIRIVCKACFGKEGIGQGDLKLVLGLGALAGVSQLPLLLILASASALLYTAARRPSRWSHSVLIVPFGPFLTLAGFITTLFGKSILMAIHGAL